jgi:hypothetical protein
MMSAICCICGSKRRTSNSMMVLAVLFIWSMESSNELMRSWMSVRSNGVINVRRTAMSTSRVTSSASLSRSETMRQ